MCRIGLNLATAFFFAVLLVTTPGTLGGQQEAQQVAELLRSGQFEPALSRLDPLLKANPDDIALLTLRGMALQGLGRNGDSVASFQAALARKPDYLPALQGLAQAEYGARAENAGATLEKILAVQPENPTARAMLGVLAAEQQDCARAVGHFDHAQEALANNLAGLWQQAACLFEVGRLPDAETAYRRILAMRPDSSSGKFNLALTLSQREAYGEAIVVLKPIAEAGAPEPDVLSLLADAYESANQTPQAVETLQRAVKLHPKEEQIYLQLAELCVTHGSYDLADEVLEAGSRQLGPSARLYTMRGVVYAQQGRLGKSEEAFEQASLLNANDEITAMGLTLTLQEDGRLDEALALLRKQLEENPQHAGLNYMLAQALVKQGIEPGQPGFDEALGALQRSLDSDPGNVRSRATLGQLYLKNGQTERAIEELGQALEREPSNRTASYQLMLAFRKAGRNEEAAALMEKVRRLVDEDRREEIGRNRYRLVRTDTADRP